MREFQEIRLNISNPPQNGSSLTKVRTIDPKEDMYEIAKSIEDHYLDACNILSKMTEYPLLSKIGIDTKNLIEAGHLRVSISQNFPSLTFFMIGMGGKTMARIASPMNWIDMSLENPLHEFGAVVFTGSQGIDIHHGRLLIDGSDKIKQRALSYESEYVKTISPEHRNDHHKKVIEMYPNGFDSKLKYSLDTSNMN